MHLCDWADRKDALEVQKTSGSALYSAITFQVALVNHSLFHTLEVRGVPSLTRNYGEKSFRDRDAHIPQ